jgi:hypothetical protein
MEFQHTDLWGKFYNTFYQNNYTMKPSFRKHFIRKTKGTKKLPTEKSFVDPQGEF